VFARHARRERRRGRRRSAIDAFTQAVAHGSDPASAATSLKKLASDLAAAGHPAEADQATQHITG